MLGYGTDGTIQKQKYELHNQTYILLEFIKGGPFNDFCKHVGAMGEAIGRLFMNQLVDVITYLHEIKGIIHRDLKLENILITNNLKLKVSDFGCAS